MGSLAVDDCHGRETGEEIMSNKFRCEQCGQFTEEDNERSSVYVDVFTCGCAFGYGGVSSPTDSGWGKMPKKEEENE